jgi:hypothetical protein
MSKIKIEKLIEKLPSNYAIIVSDKLSVSKRTVYLAIERAKMDHPVILEMIRLAEEYQESLRKIEERIDKIAS